MFGTEVNLAQAKAWYQKAADQGNAEAKAALQRLGAAEAGGSAPADERSPPVCWPVPCESK